MSTTHHMTHANELYQGASYNPVAYAINGRKGVPVMPLTKMDFGAPVAADPDAVATAQAVAGAGNLTLDGALVVGGVATLDVPRAVDIVSTAAGDTTQTATVIGTDVYGAALVEAIAFNGVTPVNGKKAFKTITQIAVDSALAGNASAGSADILGLPYKVASVADVLRVMADGADEKATSALVAADTAVATATTGDVRGTVVAATALDGSVDFVAWGYVSDKDNAFGVEQFGG